MSFLLPMSPPLPRSALPTHSGAGSGNPKLGGRASNKTPGAAEDQSTEGTWDLCVPSQCVRRYTQSYGHRSAHSCTLCSALSVSVAEHPHVGDQTLRAPD